MESDQDLSSKNLAPNNEYTPKHKGLIQNILETSLCLPVGFKAKTTKSESDTLPVITSTSCGM